MITGDHPLTAAAIGRDLGLVGDGARAVTGAELGRARRRPARRDGPRGVDLRARLARGQDPHRRGAAAPGPRGGDDRRRGQRRSRAQAGGHRRGDGDHRHRRHQGRRRHGAAATTTSRRSSRAVGEGRVVFDNIRKFIRNILSGNVAEVAVMVLAPLAGHAARAPAAADPLAQPRHRRPAGDGARGGATRAGRHAAPADAAAARACSAPTAAGGSSSAARS